MEEGRGKLLETPGYRKLVAWQKAHAFLGLVLKASEKFPRSEESRRQELGFIDQVQYREAHGTCHEVIAILTSAIQKGRDT